MTGLPFDYREVQKIAGGVAEERHDTVVFPHRLDPEKQPHLFEQMAHRLSIHEWRFLRTMQEFTTKERYYRQLANAKVSVSFSLQETFGYAMLESAALGCRLVVPDRLSYRETVPEAAFYQSFEQSIEKVWTEMRTPWMPEYDLDRYLPEAVVERMLAYLTV